MNIRFGQTVPRLRAPIPGRITRIRHQDDLADSLRDASTWLWRIANSIDAYHGKPVRPRPARRTPATRVTLCGGMLAGMGLMYVMDRDAGRRHRALVRDQKLVGHNGCPLIHFVGMVGCVLGIALYDTISSRGTW